MILLSNCMVFLNLQSSFPSTRCYFSYLAPINVLLPTYGIPDASLPLTQVLLHLVNSTPLTSQLHYSCDILYSHVGVRVLVTERYVSIWVKGPLTWYVCVQHITGFTPNSMEWMRD